MNLDIEDGGTRAQGSAAFDVSLKEPRIFYSRELLLSLSNLDICKKLPSGFDGFDESLLSISDRPRIPGSQPLHGFRRNDYSSSPPTRGDYNNNSRGIHGKWENRSSGRSDRDSDSQSDRDSDSGKRYGYQSRRSWQTPEHDGLLGSGSFPRPSGYASGVSAPNVRTSEHYQLGKSNEAYHPPRPYKATPYSKRDSDSFNDETFGSTDCTSEDRTEEERRRRASFEMMRKEQQKVLQEKHNSNLEKNKASIEESKQKGLTVASDESEISVPTTISSHETSYASHSPATRPLFPPGFRGSVRVKSLSLKSPIHCPRSEGGKLERGLELEANIAQIGTNDGLEHHLSRENSVLDVQTGEQTQQAPLLNKQENLDSQTILHLPIGKLSMEEKLPPSTSHLDSRGSCIGSEIVEFDAELEEKSVGDSERSYSSSILSNIFSGTLSINDGSSTKHNDGNPDDAWNPNSAQSSKFAQWFLEAEAKPADDALSGPPNDILSLIVGGHKVKHQVSDVEATDQFSHEVSDGAAAEQFSVDFSLKTLEHGIRNPPDTPLAADPVLAEVVSPAVLTCEDLEQSILAEIGSDTTDIQRSLRSWNTPTAESESGQSIVSVDDHASVHLLSLLHKGTEQKNMTPDSGGASLSGKLIISQEYDTGTAVDQSKPEGSGQNILSSGNTVTLETLFGSAFMKELQSVGAPVSVQRGSNGSDHVDVPGPRELPFPIPESGIESPVNRIVLQRLGDGISSSDSRLQTNHNKVDRWLGVDNSPVEIQLQKHHTETFSINNGSEGVGGFQLPTEDSLISLGNSHNRRTSTFMPTGNSSNNLNFSSNAHLGTKDKLSALSTALKEERDIGSSEIPFTVGPYEQLEPEVPYQNLQVQQPPQFLSPQMTQSRPLYHQVESDPGPLSSQMKFSNSEPMFNKDFPANPPLSRNILRPPFHHPNLGASGFDSPAHNSILHQMQIRNYNLPQILPDFARSGPFSNHGNPPTGLIEEMNQMQGFPLGPPRQTNVGSHGMPIPGPRINSGGNPSEAFQRLIEMELRTNPKQIHPLFASGSNQGIFGHEVDMGSRYR